MWRFTAALTVWHFQYILALLGYTIRWILTMWSWTHNDVSLKWRKESLWVILLLHVKQFRGGQPFNRAWPLGLVSSLYRRVTTSSMETSSALLALCEGNPPVTGWFPSQRPMTQSFDEFFDLRLNKRLSKQPGGCHAGDLRGPHAHYDVTVMREEYFLIWT